MQKNISLEGNLKYFYLSNILQLISTSHKTGALNFTYKNKSAKIIFNDGTIIFASGTKTELKLGFLLKGKNILTAKQLKKFLIISKEKAISLGKLLVDESIISSNVLETVLKKQLSEILYDLFFWEDGVFKFIETELDLTRIIVSPLDLVSLILEASKRLDKMTVLKEHIPNNSIVFDLTEKSKGKNIEFVSNEWSILNLIDGKKNIQDIISKSNLDKFTIYKMLFSLISSGFIKKI